MKRVQVQFEEQDYQTIKKIAFVENRSISEIIREATKIYLNSKKDIDEKLNIVFASDQEVEKAMKESFRKFDYIYKKLSQ